MRSSRIAVIFLMLAVTLWSLSATGHTSRQPSDRALSELDYPVLVAAYHGADSVAAPSRDTQGTGIKENVASKYAARYQEWKAEFLSTEAGRNQWAHYQDNPKFTLTISIARENAEGATTGNYKWNDVGELTAATITLGANLDAGYPNPIYFPVMNSLVPTGTSYRVAGDTLAATKLAHEFGHVNRTARVDSALYELQTQLIPQYNKIFLGNGRNPNDPKLIELARQIGGTPVEIWEDREYWGEANAMLYLRDRFTEESLRCSLFNKIRQSVDLYAKSYEPRFLEIARATPSRKVCGWP